MAEEVVQTPAVPDGGAASPAVNPNPNVTPNQPQSVAQPKEVPFNEDPRIQDYLRRQEDKVRQEERQRWADASAAAQPKIDPIAEVRAQLDAKHKAGTLTPTDLIDYQTKIAEIIADQRIKTAVNPTQATVGEMVQKQRISSFAARVGPENWARAERKVMEIFASLPAERRALIANDDYALMGVYQDAIRLVPAPSSSQDPQNGTSIQNRGGNRMPAGDNDLSRASAALVGKDKKAYAEMIARLQQNR